MIAKADRQAADTIKQAQQQTAAEQARVKNIQTQLTSYYKNTQSNVQEMVTRSLADVNLMREALLKLQNNFEDTKKLLPDSNSQEKTGE